ncbi:unnamed protein product [Candidula unifasciata]|uniref:G-protein coupled receptors family 1 profile domain-containing protein n=1 Tax=Candidula unifasciata TaxID=100452 RepID=A0A8S3YS09_9EUPU|nr:unnamed protein product [Candidula unifasciata]
MAGTVCRRFNVNGHENISTSIEVNWTNNITAFDSSSNRTAEVLDKYIIYVLEIFTNCVLLNIISLFGIIGNIINIIVLWKHGFRETTNILLISLSAFDLMCSIILPVTRLKYIVSQFDEGLAISFNTFATVYLFMPKYACLATSFTYVTIIAVERFTAVFFPFKVSRIFSSSNTKVIAAVTPMCCLLALSPTFSALTYRWNFDARFNETTAVLEYTQFYRENHDFLDLYVWVGLNNFFGSSSNVIITSCCVSILVKLSRVTAKREALTSRKTGYDVRVVKMLVTVCVVFLAASTPNIVLYSYFAPNYIFVSPVNELVDNICVVFYAVNGSANFLVYVTMSKKFANTYKMLMSCSKT